MRVSIQTGGAYADRCRALLGQEGPTLQGNRRVGLAGPTLYCYTNTEINDTMQGERRPLGDFSDRYGVWFPQVRHEWYEKDPDTVTESEFSALLRDFDEKLAGYSEI